MQTALNKFDLTRQTALITGAAGLLGREHAAALLEVGATVVLTDIGEDALSSAKSFLSANAPSERILTRVMDVSQAASVRAVAEPERTAASPGSGSRTAAQSVQQW